MATNTGWIKHALLVGALLLGVSTQAHASDDAALTPAQKDALSARIAGCEKLPSNKQARCVQGARKDYSRMDPSLSPAQKAALEREDARYEAAVAACQKRPRGERTTCRSEAGSDYRLAGLRH